MSEVKKGDVVQLKSADNHHVKMTVESIEHGTARCVWLLAGEIKRANIMVEALKLV